MKKLIILSLLFCALPVRAEDDALSVVACMRANATPKQLLQQVELTKTGPGESIRMLEGRVLVRQESSKSGDLIHSTLRIDGPSDVRGAAYLFRQEEPGVAPERMYVYLPSVKRVRQITGSFADGSLLGTNFSYNDFKQLQTGFAGAIPVLEPEAKVGSRETYVLLFNAPAPEDKIGGRPDPNTPRRSVRAWVDKDTCVPIKAEYFENQKLRKRLTAPEGALVNAGKFWYLKEMRMTDVKDETHTVLRIHKTKLGKDVSKEYFDPDTFYQAN